MPFLEVACFNAESALVASDAGADRIELCDSPEVGGTTPDIALLSAIRDRIAIPIFVMIRPRGGDFVYSEDEFQQMKVSILQFERMANGFVFGILDNDHKVDIRRTTELVKLAHPLPCTFHRAFDDTPDLFEGLGDIVKCGSRAILTSGGAPTAVGGCGALAQLVEKANGKIVILAGGGVRSGNITEIKSKTNATFFHSSALMENERVASFVEIQQLQNLVQ